MMGPGPVGMYVDGEHDRIHSSYCNQSPSRTFFTSLRATLIHFVGTRYILREKTLIDSYGYIHTKTDLVTLNFQHKVPNYPCEPLAL